MNVVRTLEHSPKPIYFDKATGRFVFSSLSLQYIHSIIIC